MLRNTSSCGYHPGPAQDKSRQNSDPAGEALSRSEEKLLAVDSFWGRKNSLFFVVPVGSPTARNSQRERKRQRQRETESEREGKCEGKRQRQRLEVGGEY